MTNVLLVDDNDRQRKLSRAYLEEAGYAVQDASNAYEALRAARTKRPDVIVSDVMMDRVDGFGLCRRLQDDGQLASIPVVLVSAHYDDEAARALARTLGASDLIGRTPDFSAEIAGIRACVRARARRPTSPRRMSYEAHLEANARELTKLLEQTRRAELRWRTVFENAYDVVALLTPAGVILEASKAWQEVLGIAPEAMIGHHIREYAAAGLAEENVAAFHELVDVRSAQQVVQLRHANGSTVFLEFASRVIDVDGAPHVIAIGRDITARIQAEQRAADAEAERRELEARLAHAQRVETIGQLTGGIAHDFSNILAVILANTESLVDDLEETDSRHADVAEIHAAALRATALAKRLLGFCRRHVPSVVEVDVGSVVRSVTRMLHRVLGSGISLAFEEHAGVAMVKADLVQLEQVIVNLVVNARDAMPSGGRLLISTEATPSAVILSVTDTGCGMSEETQRHVFEPFFTTKPNGQGTGLGLSTCLGIVKQLGGDIAVSSELGRGTTIEVSLPRVDPNANDPCGER